MMPLTAPFDCLLSYHYFKDGEREKYISELAGAGGRIIGDSGAFSAMTSGEPIDLEDFSGWIARNQQLFCWVASLDRIGDPVGSLANYRYLRRNGLRVVPTVHFGGTGKDLDVYVEAGEDFIGLGGVAARKDRAATLRWLVSMFKYARAHHPGVRFHGWGMTGRNYISHLPFYSVDSSGFSSGYRYGKLVIWDPGIGRTRQFQATPAGVAKHWDLLRSVYGADHSDFSSSSASNRSLHVWLSALSAQEMGRFYTRRHQTTPPTGQTGLGTRVHLAEAERSTYRHISDRIQRSTGEVS